MTSSADRRRWRTALLSLCAVVAYAAAVEWLCGWRSLYAAWAHLPLWLAPVFVCTMLLSYLLRAWRLYGSAAAIPRGQFASTLRLLWLHNAANLLLPARLGEWTLPWLLRRRYGIGWAHGGGLLLWLRLLDLHCVAALALVALALRQTTLPAGIWLPAAAAVAALPLLLYALRRRLATASRLRRWSAAFAALPAAPLALLRELALTWLAWLAKLTAFVLVLRSLAGASTAAALLGAIGGDASTLLPLHAPAGAGTFEAGVILGFGAAPGALAAAVTLHLLLLGTALLAALLSLTELPLLERRHDAVAC